MRPNYELHLKGHNGDGAIVSALLKCNGIQFKFNFIVKVTKMRLIEMRERDRLYEEVILLISFNFLSDKIL